MAGPCGSGGAISIHALREEGDLTLILPISFFWIFLSTPSARRATKMVYRMLHFHSNFYPRPPRGGRRRGLWICPSNFSISIHALREEGDSSAARTVIGFETISIHALREEGDLTLILPISFFWIFLSTPSARRATGLPA